MNHPHLPVTLVASIALAWMAAPGVARAASSVDPPPPTLSEVSLSMVTWIAPSTLAPGQANTLCITANFRSADSEYIDRIDIDLPDAWVIGTLDSDSDPPAGGCDDARPIVAGVEPGNVLYWQSRGSLPTQCGAWFAGPGGDEYLLCAQVTVPDCSGAPWQPQWTIHGDTFGAPPNTVTGSYESLSCAAPGAPNIEVSPMSLAATQAQGTSTNQTLTLTNTGSADLNWSITEEPATLAALRAAWLGGNPAPCSAPAEVPWLSVDASSGLIGSMQYTPIVVGFDASGVTPGTHHANLCVGSNDPDAGPGNGTSLVVVPVSLTVLDSIFADGFDD